ncbi:MULTISPECIES: MFS transporter [unclassified Devosia]|uniref:MFS transporter n=1 Tax=unclassified Devosia TaxID=196773 RepID=UPI00145C8719|nr:MULTISPECIES: MFS transporter [unclassified Devosia]MBJ6988079.1 MFS transporter [Devosia sp. MC521]QMW63368.1 MFS transporter [Devosia sp. MC521]
MISLRAQITAVFALHALGNATLHTRIPDIQLANGMGDAALGLVLMGAPLGSMLAFPILSRSIERFGTKAVTLLGFFLCLAAIPPMAVIPGVIPLFILMAVHGFGSAMSAMAMNVEADRVEAQMGRRIMNSCHGAWSIAYVGASAVGGVIRGADISALVHLGSIIPLALIAIFVLEAKSEPAPPRAYAPTAQKKRFAMPSLVLLALVAVGLGAELIEGSARVWSTILMRDTFEIAAIFESAALPAMVGTMALGRLIADRYIDKFGPVPVARTLLTVAIIGLTVVSLAPHPGLVLAGFAILGAGICVIYPLSISAAARLGNAPASQNVATLSVIIQVVMLVAPMLTGLLAEYLGVRMAFAALLIPLALGWLTAGSLEDKSDKQAVASAA